MGNLVNLPNITPESLVEEESKQNSTPQNSKFSTQNYLNTRIEEGQTKKTVTIRLLPMDLKTGNPFVKVHMHNVKVPKELVADGAKPFKSYLCLSKNADIDHERFGHKCPFCEINKNAYDNSTKATDPLEKKNWQEISLANLSNEAVIVRCIERGKENEGVKFWKFNLRNDQKDPYHAIIDLFNQRKSEAEAQGRSENILDIYNGYDLTITFTQGQPVPPPTVTDAKYPSPLSNDEEQMKAWIYDEKRWQDVFTPKDYNYLSLVSQMRVPWFDKANNVWVDKEEWEKTHKKDTTEADKKIEEAKEQISQSANNKEEKLTVEFIDETANDDLPF